MVQIRAMSMRPVASASKPSSSNKASTRGDIKSSAAATDAAPTAAPPRHSVKPGCPPGLNKYSSKITQPKSQGASQAMLYATGLSEEDMDKPQVRSFFSLLFGFESKVSLARSSFSRPPNIDLNLLHNSNSQLKKQKPQTNQVGISSVWYEGNPCNMHLMDLAAEVKAGVEDAGMVGYRFNTIGVSDGISMGTDGMSFSLQSRDLIADSIETVMGAQW